MLVSATKPPVSDRRRSSSPFILAGALCLCVLGLVAARYPATEQPNAETLVAAAERLDIARRANRPPPARTAGVGDGGLLRLASQPALEKPLGVLRVTSAGKLTDMFERIGYRLEGVKENREVPRLFITSLPPDLKQIPRPSKRKVMFIKSMLPLILHANELIEYERDRLLSIRDRTAAGLALSAEEEAWLEWMADGYGVDTGDIDELLKRVDIIPPSLAIAQAAEESGWGTSRFAREGNALFGQRSFKQHRKGIVPKERKDGETYKVRAFEHLIDGVKAYVRNLNTHIAYADFRDRRAAMRHQGDQVEGYRLAESLTRYSERGEAYVRTIRNIMRVNNLPVFDQVRLGERVALNDDPPDA